MFIYVITNIVNGKKYVGQTIQQIRERFRWHIGASVKRFDTPLARAIRKYGASNFVVETIQECKSREDLGIAETKWISALNTLVPKGYNIRTGGTHSPLSAETKVKIGNALRGYVHSESRNRKISEANKGRIFSDEWREKLSKAAKNRKLSPEHKQKFTEAGRKARRKISRKGERNGRSKLTWTEVEKIRSSLLHGESQMVIASKYQVAQGTISRIKRKASWWPIP